MIFRGDKQVTSIYRGDKEVVAVYRGADKVWEKQAPEQMLPQSTIFSGTVLTEQTRLDTINNALGLSCSSVDEAWATVTEMAENGSLDLGDEQVINTLNLLFVDIPAHYNLGVGKRNIEANDQGEFEVDMAGTTISYSNAFGGEMDIYNGFVRITSLPTAPDQTNTWRMFCYNPLLEYIDATQIKVSQLNQEQSSMSMFSECAALNHIRCTKAFRDWCWANAASISLPDAMREGGNGVWDLVDDAQQIM